MPEVIQQLNKKSFLQPRKAGEPARFRSEVFRVGPGSVDFEAGVIRGVKIVTAGEALGHDIWLEDSFVNEVKKQGGGLKKGLKSRFGHPQMCSSAMGTFLGRFQNFRTDRTEHRGESGVSTCIADLHLSESAKKAPQGDLYEYTLELAKSESDMFGTSIVFEYGLFYKYVDGKREDEPNRDEFESDDEYYDAWYSWRRLEADDDKYYATCAQLLACDVVDDPAANDGLFSSDSIAGQITEFFDNHQDVVQSLLDNPELVKALNNNPNIEDFIARYSAAHKQEMEASMAKNNEAGKNALESGAAGAAEEVNAAEEEEVVTETPTEEVVETQEELQSGMTHDEFCKAKETFGAEVAAEVFAAGGSYQDACVKAFESQKARVEELESENKELKESLGSTGGKAAEYSEPDKKQRLLWGNK